MYKNNRPVVWGLLFGVLLLLLDSCSAVKHVPDEKYLLDEVKVDMPKSNINQSDLKEYIQQTPNLNIFGLFRFHLGLYNLSGSDETKGVNRWLRKIGEEPVVYDEFLTQKTNAELTRYMQNKGYTDATVSDSVVLNPGNKKARVYYTIKAGKPYVIKKHVRICSDSLLLAHIKVGDKESLLKDGMLLDLDVLDKERMRIAELLNTKGYYSFNKNFISYTVDTLKGKEHVVDTMWINNPAITDPISGALSEIHEDRHHRYKISTITYVTDYNPQEALVNQASYYQSFDTLRQGRYLFLYKEKLKIKPSALIGNTLIKPGEYYNSRHIQRTHRRLLQMPIIKYDNIRFVPSKQDSLPYHLDCIIQLTSAKTQSLQADLEGTNKSGNLGAAVKLNYQHRNLFKGAEVFNQQYVIGAETQRALDGTSAFNSQEYGINNSLVYPRFIFPGATRWFSSTLKPSTQFNLSFNYQQRPDYLRYIVKAGMSYDWQNTDAVKHSLNIQDFNYVRLPDMSDEFRDRIDNSFLRYSYQDHVIHSMAYSVVYTKKKKGQLHNSVFGRVGIEAAGNLLYFGNQWLGMDKINGSYNFFNVQFSQYVKGDLEGTYNHRLNERNAFVYHALLGVAYPYGNAHVMPFEKRYISGGANSVRAWQVRSLGPGSYRSDETDYMNQSGDIKLDLNFEYRFDLFSKMEGAFFVDAGNVWTVHSYESQPGGMFDIATFLETTAVGYGLGLRLDLSFFVFRLDGGVQLHDPGKGPTRLVLNPTLSETAFHIAIGYPF